MLQSEPAELLPGWGGRLLREPFSLGLTRCELAQLLAVDAEWVLRWEAEAQPLASSYLTELSALGVDATYLARGQPTALLPAAGLGVWLPDERLLRYCWQGAPGAARAALRRWFGGWFFQQSKGVRDE